MSQQEAVHELLQECHSYTGNEVAPSTVRPYDRARVSINPVGACTPQAIDIIDPVGREILLDAERTMLDRDVASDGPQSRPRIQPYMDEKCVMIMPFTLIRDRPFPQKYDQISYQLLFRLGGGAEERGSGLPASALQSSF